MFSPDIVCSDAFLDMPVSARDLYYQLGMAADDDGFVNPKRTMRTVGASEDDLRILLAKRFLLAFSGGVVVIKHWLIHNLIRADLYKETLYKQEKSTIGLNENGAYTELREGVSPIRAVEPPKWLKLRRGELRTANVPQTARRLGKGRVEEEIAEPISLSSKTRLEPITEVKTNQEGEERPPRRVAPPKDQRAILIRDKLYSILEADNGITPTMHMGDYVRVTEALKTLSPDQIVEMFEEAVSAKTVHTVREVFTARNIDIYRQENS